jgi:zinc transport system permease protein
VSDFLHALGTHAFLQNAFLTGLLASVACGVVGSYVVARRITYIAGAIAHCVLGGIGAARWLNVVGGWTWLQPLYGAVAAALLAALVIGIVSLRARQREDTVIGAIWAIGMAAGILFIARTPGYQEDLLGYLFGNILMVSRGDLWLVAGLDAVVLGLGLLFYHQFLAVCFDSEFARLRGVRVELFYLLLLLLTALTVVLLVTVVGIVLVIALLTLPAAVANHFSKTLWQMMAIGALCCALFTTGGLALSYAANLPAGAVIIMLAAAAWLLLDVRRFARRPRG